MIAMLDVMSLRAIYQAVRALFVDIYNQELPAYTDLAMETRSVSGREVYSWLGAVPTMHEWVSDRMIQRLGAFEYTVPNRDYALTIEIARNAIEDDQIGLYRPLIETIARQARNHPAELVYRMFGENPIGYDGRPLFATNHEEGESGSQSNVVGGFGTDTTAILTDLDKCEERFASFRNDRGLPIMVAGRPLSVTHVMCPPALKGVFTTIANAQVVSNTTNKWAGRISVLVNPYLSDANDWYALCLEYPFKPALVQIRRPATVSQFDATLAQAELFKNKRFLIGVDGRYAVAPAFWQTAIRVSNP